MKTCRKVVHVYQRSSDGGVIFYTKTDILVYFMAVCHTAVKSRIKVYGICAMPDHVHLLLGADSPEQLSSFVGICTSRFSKMYNRSVGRSGHLFRRDFGRAYKIGGKKIRTAVAYLYNNPVEKGLSSRAEDSFRNFLPFAASKHPFSEKITLRSASKRLRRAVEEVKWTVGNGGILSYKSLDRMFSQLDARERNQLSDYVVSSYSCIDYEGIIRLYGSYEKMLVAINSNTGSEYDINEEFTSFNDRCYSEMHSFAFKKGYIKNPKDIINLSPEIKKRLSEDLRRHGIGTDRAIRKYLHI